MSNTKSIDVTINKDFPYIIPLSIGFFDDASYNSTISQFSTLLI
jgi:hypothetical protein